MLDNLSKVASIVVGAAVLVGVVFWLVQMGADVRHLQGDMRDLQGDVTQLQLDVVVLQTDVTQLQSDMTELQSDVTELQSDVTQLQLQVAEVQQNQQIIIGILRTLVEDTAETQVPAPGSPAPGAAGAQTQLDLLR